MAPDPVQLPDPRSMEDTLSAFRQHAAPEDLLLVTGSHDLVATVLRRTTDGGQ